MLKRILLHTFHILVLSVLVNSVCAEQRVPPTDENTLTYFLDLPSSIDPVYANGSGDIQVLPDIFDGLMHYDQEGKVVNGVVKDWTLDKSQTVYTFNLKKDSYWSDGVRVTAQDFVLQLQRLVDPKVNLFDKPTFLGVFILNAQAIISGLMPVSELGVKAVDDFTLQVCLESPAPFFISVLAHPVFSPVPSHVIKKYGNAWFENGHFLSNGGYIYDNKDTYSKSIGTLFLRKNYQHKYANDTYFDYVEAKSVKTKNMALTMFSKGEIDILNGFDGYMRDWVMDKLSATVEVYPENSTTYLSLNLNNKKLQDIRVRQAMSYALLRDQLVERLASSLPLKVNYTYSNEAKSIGWQEIVPDWATDNTPEQLISMAQALMREAGYGPQNPLELEFRYNETILNDRLSSGISAMWTRIWIKVIKKKAPISEHYAAVRNGDYEVARYGWSADYDDPSAYFIALADDFREFFPNVEQAEYQRFCKDLLLYQSNDERRELVEKIEKNILEHVYIIPIYSGLVMNVLQPSLQPVKFSFLKGVLSRYVRPKALANK